MRVWVRFRVSGCERPRHCKCDFHAGPQRTCAMQCDVLRREDGVGVGVPGCGDINAFFSFWGALLVSLLSTCALAVVRDDDGIKCAQAVRVVPQPPTGARALQFGHPHRALPRRNTCGGGGALGAASEGSSNSGFRTCTSRPSARAQATDAIPSLPAYLGRISATGTGLASGPMRTIGPFHGTIAWDVSSGRTKSAWNSSEAAVKY